MGFLPPESNLERLFLGAGSFFFRNLVYYPVAAVTAGPVRRYLGELMGSQHHSRDAIVRAQQVRLRGLLRHCRDHVPYYAGLDEGVIGDLSRDIALDSLPFLRKGDLQRSGAALRSTVSLGKLVSKTTGGSTGEPVTLTKTRDAWARELAATWRGYEWANVEVGDLQARFWGVAHGASGRRRARLIDAACNRMRISAFSFSDDDMERYARLLEARRPAYFYGYVSMLTEFARFLVARQAPLRFAPKCVITTSEVLGAADRSLLSEVFRAPVFNEYGCGELGTVAHECRAGSLHLSEENMIVEIVDGEAPCAAGQPGELVVTELNNFATPLVRYRTGDFGSISTEPCDCGRTLLRLNEIQGRAYDFIRNRRGQKFHGEFLVYVFEDLRRQGASIRQFQVIQEDLDRFMVRIVQGGNYDESCEVVIADRIRDSIDPEARVAFEYVDRIARERSGKLVVIKGLV